MSDDPIDAEIAVLNDPWHVAVHEAGHVVIGYVAGFGAGAVTIVPNLELREAGYAITADPYAVMSEWESRDRFRDYDSILRARAIIFMAGAEAEIEICGDCLGGDGGDRREVRDALDRIETFLGKWRVSDPEEVNQYYEPRLRRWTGILVKRHRVTIERVAAALFERWTLSAEEIEALINEATAAGRR